MVKLWANLEYLVSTAKAIVFILPELPEVMIKKANGKIKGIKVDRRSVMTIK